MSEFIGGPAAGNERGSQPEGTARPRVQVWHGINHVPEGFGPSVVTIGNFDGVHRGHQAVLARVVSRAREAGASAVALTFDPHPAVVHRPQDAPGLLTGIEERIALIAQTGIDAIVVLPYSLEFAKQSPQEFVAKFLAGPLRPRCVVVGHDVRFGWQNAGDLSTMIELGHAHGFDVEAVDDLGQNSVGPEDCRTDRWSSTYIRTVLASGDVRAANEALGRQHAVRGIVVHGDARGRELGYPTANLGSISGFIPADGVYAGWLERLSPDELGTLPAAISIGTNPTFDGAERRVEAYVLDRTDLDLYDDEVRLTFVARLRPTVRFDSVDALVLQMAADVDQARGILSA